jgi:hypothetical protein
MLTELRRRATDFRAAIERSRAEKASPHLPYFPEGACTMASWLFAMHLSKSGFGDIHFRKGRIPVLGEHARHGWLVVGGTVVDLTADPFGEAPVVVAPSTAFHDSLTDIEDVDAATGMAAFTPAVAERYQRFLAQIEARLPSEPSAER